MDQKKFHFRILIVPFAVCLFMYVDTYIFPVKATDEYVQEMNKSNYRRNSYTYFIETNRGEFDITKALFNALSAGDTLKVYRSALTGVPQKAYLDRKVYAATYDVGFVNGRSGLLFVPIILLGTILFRFLYTALKNLQGRINMTYFLLIASLVLLFFYLGF